MRWRKPHERMVSSPLYCARSPGRPKGARHFERARCTCNAQRRVHRTRRFMTGILIIAHAPLASALERCVEHVYSCEPGMTRANLRVLDVEPGAPMDELLVRAQALLQEVNSGAGVLVLTDAFGATPG